MHNHTLILPLFPLSPFSLYLHLPFSFIPPSQPPDFNPNFSSEQTRSIVERAEISNSPIKAATRAGLIEYTLDMTWKGLEVLVEEEMGVETFTY